jgi:hypothetical protein
VEAGCAQLSSTNSAAPKARYTTSDYIRVNDPRRFSGLEVSLRNYPDVGTFVPFEDWSAPESTRSIPWREAYNSLEHRREAPFSHASLESLINAVAAVHILQADQLVRKMYERSFGANFSPFGNAASGS